VREICTSTPFAGCSGRGRTSDQVQQRLEFLLFFRAFYFSLLLCWIIRGIFQRIINSLLAIMLFLNNSTGAATEQQSWWTKQQPAVG
jgi:hypothetical protein